jgi:DNA repair protein RadC
VRRRYEREGLESFQYHEILELLLFHAIARCDTNVIGHRLIEQFGSLAEALDADKSELLKVEGVGENAANLLSLMPALARVYFLDKWGTRPCLGSLEELGEYAAAMFIGVNYEEFVLLCLDSKLRLKTRCTVHKGTVNQTPAYPRLFVEAALKYKAQNVVIAHNHPNLSPTPSLEDVEATRSITKALEAIDINVVDHVIVAGNRYISMTQAGYMGA